MSMINAPVHPVDKGQTSLDESLASITDLDEHMSSVVLDGDALGRPTFGTLTTLDDSIQACNNDNGSASSSGADKSLPSDGHREEHHASTASSGDSQIGGPGPLVRRLSANGGLLEDKLNGLLRWGGRAFRSTKQIVREQLGGGGGWRTIDAELEVQVALLKDTQHKYARLLSMTRALTLHVGGVVTTQETLADHFAELAVKSPELHDDFKLNADAQHAVASNGKKLLAALNFFVSSVTTLCNKTIGDTLLTVDRYESARLAFDACRNEYESLAHERRTPTVASRLETAKADYEANKVTFERLRDDVNVKLHLLDENRVKVMHRQLIMFHEAVVSYFSGDQQLLEATLTQFSIKMDETEKPS